MGAASLHLYRRDRQVMVANVVCATLLVLLALLAFGAVLDVMTVDTSLVNRLLTAPFRWAPGDSPTLA